MKISDFAPEIAALKSEGYEIIEPMYMDYDRTLRLHVKKDGKDLVFPLVECMYDTDASGNRTAWHGVYDIRETAWSKALR